MTRPAAFPLALYRGDSYSWRFVVWTDEAKTQPADLTGVVATSQVRDKPGGTDTIDMHCTVTMPNIVDVKLLATDWGAFFTTVKVAAWDLQLKYPGGDVFTLVAGVVTITQDVTIP